jgi:hypothetical protein
VNDKPVVAGRAGLRSTVHDAVGCEAMGCAYGGVCKLAADTGKPYCLCDRQCDASITYNTLPDDTEQVGCQFSVLHTHMSVAAGHDGGRVCQRQPHVRK